MKEELEIGVYHWPIQFATKTELFLARLLGKKLTDSNGFIFSTWRGKIYLLQEGNYDIKTSKAGGDNSA